jgi:hypothetical protein
MTDRVDASRGVPGTGRYGGYACTDGQIVIRHWHAFDGVFTDVPKIAPASSIPG